MLARLLNRTGLRAAAAGLPRPFWFLWAGTLVNRMGTFVVPFLALYLTQALGLSLVQAGLVASLYGVGGAIAGPLGGFLADHIGRRATMIGALSLGGLSMIGLGWAHRIEVIAPAVFGVALITEMYRPGMQAAVADLVAPEDRVRAFGWIYWGINLGFSIGLALGGILASTSFRLLFVADGLASLLFAFLVWRGVPETLPAHTVDPARPAPTAMAGFFAPYRDLPFVMFLGLNVLIVMIFMQHNSVFPLDVVAHGISKAAFGAVIALNGIVIVLVQPFLTPILQRWDRARVLAAGCVLVALGFGLNGFVSTVPAYALGVVIWTFGEIGVLPVGNAVVADLAPIQVRGRYQGAYGLSWGIASFVAPALGTFVLQNVGSKSLWTGCLVLGIMVAAGHLVLGPSIARARVARLSKPLATGSPVDA